MTKPITPDVLDVFMSGYRSVSLNGRTGRFNLELPSQWAQANGLVTGSQLKITVIPSKDGSPPALHMELVAPAEFAKLAPHVKPPAGAPLQPKDPDPAPAPAPVQAPNTIPVKPATSVPPVSATSSAPTTAPPKP